MKSLVRKRHFQYFVLLLGTLSACWMMTTFTLHYDHTQILSKVHKLIVTGEWTHYGNRSTGAGYVPGTFLTAMAAGPMKLWYSPYAAMLLILLTQLICTIMFFTPIEKIFGRVSASVFLILFWLSPWRVEQIELYNPAYLFLFSGIHFFTCYKLTQKPSFWMSALHVLAIGLCAQVHFSFAILGATSLLLLLFRMVHVNWLGVLAGAGMVAFTLIPYFLSLSSQTSEGIQIQASQGFIPGKNLVLIYPVIKAVLYWLRYGSTYFARHIFTEVNFLWISNDILRSIMSAVFHFLKWPLGIGTLLFSILIQWKFLKQVLQQNPFQRKIDRKILNEKDWVFHYAFYLFLGMLVAAGLSPVEFNHWHLMLCFPTSAMLVSVGLAKLLELHQKWMWVIPAIVVYFVIYNSLATLGSKMHRAGHSYHDEVIKAYPLE